MTRHRYLVALGSNVPHHRHGPPRRVLAAALRKLNRKGLTLLAASPVIESAPVGPSLRRYANAVALIKCDCEPPELLARLKRIEARFGRRPGGQRWRARVLDLDIVLWSGGAFAAKGLTVPHIAFRDRAFVLGPALAIVPDWRDPVTGLTMRHLHHRLHRRLTGPHSLP